LRPGRFVVFFALAALLQFGLAADSVVPAGHRRILHSLVWASSFLINALGGKASAQGALLGSPTNGFTIEMRDGCNRHKCDDSALVGGVAFPVSRAWKLVGILVGALAIQGLNFFRFISLFYLGQYSQSWLNSLTFICGNPDPAGRPDVFDCGSDGHRHALPHMAESRLGHFLLRRSGCS